MKPSTQKYAIAAAVVVVLVAAVFAWPHFFSKPPMNDPKQVTVNISDFDDLQRQLAERVYKEYGGTDAGKDFSVIVATPDSGIGELLRASGSLPANSDDCVPLPAPRPVPHGHLFPAYTLSNDTAILANLGPNAVQALSSATLKLQHQSSITYQIDDPQIQLMADNAVEQVTGKGNCQAYLKDHPGLRLVRGTVTGRMTYTVKVANPASVKADLLKNFGNISVDNDTGRSTVSISDNQSQPIVALLSVFLSDPGVIPAASAPISPIAVPVSPAVSAVSPGHSTIVVAPPPPVLAASTPHIPVAAYTTVSPGIAASSYAHPFPSAPPPQVVMAARVPLAPGQPHVFIQQDAADAPDAGASLAGQLASAWPEARVERGIENVPSRKMPLTAQVRFFSAADLDTANKCLGFLKQKYPNATAVRSGLSAPQGQLEVWLPKVGN